MACHVTRPTEGERTVREIVYLSESKLRQFVPAPRRVPRTGALRVTTPLGGIDMDAPAASAEQGQLRHLRDVSKHVELMADWYAQPDLRPGQWVQFEAPLRCVTLGGAHQELVLFVDPAGRGRTGSVADEDCRLLMHGSVRHLRGWTPMSVDGPALGVENSVSSLGTAFVTRAGQVVRRSPGTATRCHWSRLHPGKWCACTARACRNCWMRWTMRTTASIRRR